MSAVARGLADVRARIERAALAAGRAPTSVRLLAVSKRQPAAAIRAAYELGQRDFGENYVQELLEKAEALRDLPGLRLHLIGQLQRNKARKVAAVAASVESVDSLELARELGKRARAVASEREQRFGPGGVRLEVLIQVSIAGEVQKGGVVPEQLGELIDAIEAQPELALRGLMCVPPLGEEPEASRVYFAKLFALREAHGGGQRLPELSMGMTADLEVAIAEHATSVRVGTAIFGERTRAQATE